ncbi:MAG: hypothetical protein Q8M92_00105 [Candidatus Subteraquimicrobiales bacterium]|nr:hypothetical protein [Candidatus Subteraquimicrobiales bacterium]
MPAVSKKQQRYFGMLYQRAKDGNMKGLSGEQIHAINSMGEAGLKDFASTKHTSLPEKIAEYAIQYGYARETSMIDGVEMEKDAFFLDKLFKPIAAAFKSNNKLLSSIPNAVKARPTLAGGAGTFKGVNVSMKNPIKVTGKNVNVIKNKMPAPVKTPTMLKGMSPVAPPAAAKAPGHWGRTLKWTAGGLVGGSLLGGIASHGKGAAPQQQYLGQ